MSKLIYGIGINDANYNVVVSKRFGKKMVKYWTCPFYERWKNMLARCYSEKYQKLRSSYVGCLVCEDWLTFSNFRVWMASQDWEGKHLDKDIIKVGNKIYTPEFCAFVSQETNYFVLDSAKKRGDLPIGVAFRKDKRKFIANCGKRILGKGGFIGYFECHNI
jgi:hypothetical protein